MGESLDRAQTPAGVLSALCAVFSIIGSSMILGTPTSLLVHYYYPYTILGSIALLNFLAYVWGVPLLWVVAAGFMLMNINPALTAAVGKGAVIGYARAGYIIALISNLLSFVFSNPTLPATTSEAGTDRHIDNGVLTLILLTLFGQAIIWATGIPEAQAAWLIFAYLLNLPARSFLVFAATVVAPRFFLDAVHGTSPLYEVGAAICAASLAGIVTHYLYHRWVVDGGLELDRSILDPRKYFQTPFDLTRLVLLCCSIAGMAMVWRQQFHDITPCFHAAILVLATVLNQLAIEMRFSRLVITAITLIYSMIDTGAGYAQEATLLTDDLLLLGWLLLFVGSIGTSIMALPITFSEFPNFRDKNVITPIVLGLILLGGCVGVWFDRRTDNNVLSLGLLGLVLIFSGAYGYREGVEVVFHAAILLLATYTPSSLMYLPWIALAAVITFYCPGHTEYTSLEGSSPSGRPLGKFWQPVAV